MKSSIKIDFTEVPEQGLQPIISVILENSDDPRDGLLRTFFQQLEYESNWLTVQFAHHIVSDVDRGNFRSFIKISPVKPKELKAESEEMALRVRDKERHNYTPLFTRP